MKPALEYLPKDAGESFIVRSFNYPFYPTPWHFHPEFEIVLVTESTGKRFIGDAIANFKPGNLVLLGSNLPHLYRNDTRYYQHTSTLHARSIVLHFSETSFGDGFFTLPELKRVKLLLAKSTRGIEITGQLNKIISRYLQELLNLEGFARCIRFFEILDMISHAKKLPLISSAKLTGINEKESDRMNTVLNYMVNNFTTDIHRADVARLSNMSENAFSRYFSQRTRKTFSRYLNDLRLSHAAELLVVQESSIASVCYECGFNNLSNFNRHFRARYGTSALQYRKQFWENH